MSGTQLLTRSARPPELGSTAPVSSPAVAAVVSLFVVAAFLPYAGVGLTAKQSISACSVIGVVLVAILLVRRSPLPVVAVLVLVAPVISGFLQVCAGFRGPDPNGLVLWAINMAPMFGAFAVVALGQVRVALRTTRVMVAASCGYALIQKFLFIDRGVLPLQWIYSTPGYARVNADVVLQYVRRPFGWFPEPSVLAVAVSLGLAAVTLLEFARHGRTSRWTNVLLVLVMVTLYLSRSGSLLFALALLPAMVLGPYVRQAKIAVLATCAVPLAALAASNLIADRNSSWNFSWGDRATSISASGGYLIGSFTRSVTGVGRGQLPSLFDTRQIQAAGADLGQQLRDIASVLGRIVMENGLVIGTGVVVALVVVIYRAAARRMPIGPALALTVLWILSAGLTTSYENVAVIWLVPGLALGLLADRQFRRSRADHANR
jgi:hypothetical protein